ncbi:MAG: 2-amino-4-hydroxy-6-hydroxymethyldihydropteridine diphosphokinase [Candidatus Omnitrophota bacterium]
MVIAYLGIGSNIGDKEENCKEAVRRLSQTDDIQIEKQSSFYLTLPVDGPPSRGLY